MNEENIKTLTNLLSKLTPGHLPLSIFLEITRLTTTPIIEIVPLKFVDEEIYVLLTKREDDDPNWPGMWHTPGTVVRATDREGSFEDAFERIIAGELNGTEVAESPVFVGNLLHKVKRGMESAMIYRVRITGETKSGSFFKKNELPENIIDTQKDFIQMAINNFENYLQRQ